MRDEERFSAFPGFVGERRRRAAWQSCWVAEVQRWRKTAPANCRRGLYQTSTACSELNCSSV